MTSLCEQGPGCAHAADCPDLNCPGRPLGPVAAACDCAGEVHAVALAAGARASETPALTDEQIDDIATRAYRAGRLPWLGFKKDAEGRYTIPLVNEAERALIRECIAGVGAPRGVADAALAFELADESARVTVETTALVVPSNAKQPIYDVSQLEPEVTDDELVEADMATLRRAVRYLDARGMLVRPTGNPMYVSFTRSE